MVSATLFSFIKSFRMKVNATQQKIPEELSRVSAWVEQHSKLWEQKLDSFEDYLNELKLKNKENE